MRSEKKKKNPLGLEYAHEAKEGGSVDGWCIRDWEEITHK